RQVLQRLEAEELEKSSRGSIQERPACGFLLAEDADEIALEERAKDGAAIHAADVVDVWARDGVAIRDERCALELGAREAHRLLADEIANEGRVRDVRSEGVAARDFFQLDAAARVLGLQLF